MSFIKRTKLHAPLLAGVLVATAANLIARASEASPASPAPARAALKADAEIQTTDPLPKNAERLSHGRFQGIIVYHPEGNPKNFALFLSDDGGWNLRGIDMAQTLIEQGAMVVGIDTPKLLEQFEHNAGEFVFPDGDLENLSHWVQTYTHLPMVLPPILVGYSSGATLAYAALVQASKDTFAGALSVGFCPELTLHKPLCKGSGIESKQRPDGHGVNLLPAKNLSNSWIVLQGEIDQVCTPEATREFVAAVPGAEIVSLPKVGHGYSVPANWHPQYKAAFTKIAAESMSKAPPPTPAALAARGIPVVGLDSLRYYGTPHTPDSAANDADRLLRYYLAYWNKKRALLIGYSQGADVLPFILNRHPKPLAHELHSRPRWALPTTPPSNFA